MSTHHRIAYLAATYTGARAALNRARALTLPGLRASGLAGTTLSVDGVEMDVRVHARPRSDALEPGWRVGMISLRLVEAPVAGPSYGLLLATSHFGCGHVEVAFCEKGEQVVLFGVRNVLRANVERLGERCKRVWLREPVKESALLRALTAQLAGLGLVTSLARPADCVALCVDPRLVPPDRMAETLQGLEAFYRRRWRGLRECGMARPLCRPAAAPDWTPRPSPAFALLALHPLLALMGLASFTLHLSGVRGGWVSRLGFGDRPDLLGLHAELSMVLSWSLAAGFVLACLAFSPRIVGMRVSPRLRTVLDRAGAYGFLCFLALCMHLAAPGLVSG